MSNFPDRHAWGALPRWMGYRSLIARKKVLLLLLVATLPLWGVHRTTYAQESTPLLITFTDFTGSGFSPSPTAGQLDSDSWSISGFSDEDLPFGGTQTSGDYARGPSNGGVGTGGIYAFNTGDGNIILGIQPTDTDFTPGTITLRLQNNTGAPITALSIGYDIFFRNDQARANSLNFSYSSDDSTYIDVPSLNFTTPEAAAIEPAWLSESRTTTLTGLSISSNAFYYLRWLGHDVSGSGSRDEYGLDNISVVVASPEIDVQGNGQSIASGDTTPAVADHTDFGSALVEGGAVVRTFTIANTGSAPLTVGTVSVGGTNAGDFSVTQPVESIVEPNESTTFDITFDPSAAGVRTATVSIANDDADENPYTFAIQGEGLVTVGPSALAQILVAQLCYNRPDPSYQEKSVEGVCTVTFTLQNTSGNPVTVGYYRVNTLTNNNWILNADPEPAQAGAIVLPLAGQSLVADTATFTPQFVMGLMSTARYTLRFSVFGYVDTSAAAGFGGGHEAVVELGVFEVALTPTLPSNNVKIFLPAVGR